MHFHKALGRAMKAQGITDVFGIIGDGNLFIIDSFQRAGGGKFYSVSNEASGLLAASGYARSSGRLGVATVTHGPALTNTITALTDNVRSRTPLLLIAGDTDIADRDNLQNIPQREMLAPTGAGFEQVRSPESGAVDLATAIRRAWLERRPIVLNVPANFQWAEVEEVAAPSRTVVPQAIVPDPEAAEAAVGAIAGARRPIVLAGIGAISPTAKIALVSLAQRIGAPLATTLQAQGLFRGEAHDLGVFGVSSTGARLETILQADTIIAFGASLNRFTTAEGSTLEGKTVVQVDIDPGAFQQYSTVDVPVMGDAAKTAEAFLALLNEAEIPPTRFASAELAARLVDDAGEPYTDQGSEATIDVRTAIDRLEKAMPADRTLVTDAGRFIATAFERIHAPEPRAFVSTVAFGSIGLGMANAIGASVGRPGHPVLLVTGDGGFMLGGFAELLPAIRHGVDLVVALLNDGSYGAEHIQFTQRSMDPTISTFDWPDFGPVMDALGGKGFTVRTLPELDAALAAIETRDRPILIDIKLDPWRVPGGGH